MLGEIPEGEGVVSNIQRFSIHDGPGIRTTVFLKGCPLRCQWCSNPESMELLPQIIARDAKCIGSGRCVSTGTAATNASNASTCAHRAR
jgi:pyruvate formate lyase activating enzyme